MSIDDKQAEIIEEFGMLDGDMEMSINYVIELGQRLEDYPDDKRDENHIVKGCQSKVWLVSTLSDSKMSFDGDSNTAVTKGLVSLLLRVLNNEKPEDILNADLYFPERIGMNRFIGTQRSNGFAAMIKQMRLDALAINSQIESK
ncbi:MAG: cysteine desulfuration protein SufE [Cyclobacteriaceae bacterium]|jgi:cysteine desulfuration protein SufE